MKNIKLYLSLALILTAFAAGLLSGNSRDAEKELEAKYKEERKLILDQLQKKQVEIWHLNEAQKAIERRRVSDSIRFAGALERNQRAYNALKKKYNEINLSRASHAQLDSIIFVLFPN